MINKRWNILPTNISEIQKLQKELKVNTTICTLLTQRSIKTYNQAKDFFRPNLDNLHDPFLMKDMQKAVVTICNAINNNEGILIFGDYDVDGTTAVASMYQFIKLLHANVQYYIPHRYREGYGVSKAGIDFAKANNISLIISLDCGIKSIDLVAYAKQLCIEFIICDHHLPDKELPNAAAILNPKQVDCNYPFKELCGCGVGLKLMQALSHTFGLAEETYLQFLDLVASAIAADIVPIVDENRIFAYYGIKKINTNPCAGIKALLKTASVQKILHISDLVFFIAPRINAAGRMDDAKKAVQLFIEQDEEAAIEIASLLHSDNTDRREEDAKITEEALNMLADIKNDHKKTTVVYQPHWHKGVVGIVASRLIENYYRPTIVLTNSGEIAAGSARSVVGFNLYEAIYACKEYLLGYGGHFAAAGMTLLPENIPAFANKFEEVVANSIKPETLIPQILIDAEILFSDVTEVLYNLLLQMEPFGPENMKPIFVSRQVLNNRYSKVVKEKHIRFVVEQNGITLTGIGYNLAHKFYLLESGNPFDIVFNIGMNDFNGKTNLQIVVLDIKACA